MAEEEDNSGSTRKKRKTNGYYPLNLLGEVAAGVIPVNFHGILRSGEAERNGFAASWCTEVSCSPVEADSKSRVLDSARAKDRAAEASRPPLVRTSRGRVQVLPSRFNDSVIDNWRKDTKTSLRDYTFDDEDFECKKDKLSSRTLNNSKQKAKFQRPEEKNGYNKGRKFGTLCGEDEVEEGHDASFYMRKYSSSRSSLTSMHEQFFEDHRYHRNDQTGGFAVVDKVPNVNASKKDGLYGPEDFYSGDIVWAKSGRKEPYWPAIVIDPMTQAPELVLRSCIPDAACVMFFGHSGNENQRVSNKFYCVLSVSISDLLFIYEASTVVSDMLLLS